MESGHKCNSLFESRHVVFFSVSELEHVLCNLKYMEKYKIHKEVNSEGVNVTW